MLAVILRGRSVDGECVVVGSIWTGSTKRVEEQRRTVLLHDREDFDDDLGRRSDQDLSLSSSFSVDNVVLPISSILHDP